MAAEKDDSSIINDDSQIDLSSTNNSTSGPKPAASADREGTIGRQETQVVRRLRFFLLLILLIVAISASIGFYIFARRGEIDDFEAAFLSQGQKVMNGFQEDSVRKLEAMASLSDSFTSYALNSGSSWPFVTMPNSASHFESFLRLTNSAALTIMPIVGRRQRLEWEDYTVDNQHWIAEDIAFGLRNFNATQEQFVENNAETVQDDMDMSPYIKNYVGLDTSRGPWVVWWQYAPVISNKYFVNFNRLAVDDFGKAARSVQAQKAVISRTWTFEEGVDIQSTRDFEFTSELLAASGYSDYQGEEPIVYIYYPVFDQLEGEKTTVAILSATVYWKTYFIGLLPDGANGIQAVIENSEGQAFTYSINGGDATYMGTADWHEAEFDKYVLTTEYSAMLERDLVGRREYHGVSVDNEYLSYRIKVYPTNEFRDAYLTSKPLLYSSLMVVVFLMTTGIFLLYDRIVERRQAIVLTTAVKSTAIVSSLFPENVRDRLMNEATRQQSPLEMFATETHDTNNRSSAPIADFFPEVTVIFGDIAGFTAWSSTRQPALVFTLLETIYNAFDSIAKTRKIFKVETIGDCYVAASGLPAFREDHAVTACRFAQQCILKMQALTRELELELGPGTGDLGMRFGIHSGAVTAGVLRGEKSRFQLFGDTMNTAARMESTGVKGRVQMSEETAALLLKADKGHWLAQRDDTVYAKGKGEMTTYFLRMKESASSNGESKSDSSTSVDDSVSKNDARLIDWNVGVLRRLLQQIIARRKVRGEESHRHTITSLPANHGSVIDEVREVIELPAFDSAVNGGQNIDSIMPGLPETVETQLHLFVSSVCRMYRSNPFHNFEHASHVTMSVSKLLSRIVAPTGIDFADVQNIASTLHDHTYGITSDPLTQFACIFAALIHDTDHPGVPNTQLVKEGAPLATAYNNKSVAEQNSVDLCWEMLMDDTFADLRACIYGNESELTRFRQLVVNSVMATDIMDKDLKALRNARWDAAFSEQCSTIDTDVDRNRKATIVIEHLIQSSDVAHTMQHWHVYRKWNAKLFQEMHKAWQEGRSEKNPSEYWYRGELGFFDFYIIPLAKKLKDCGVFGVSSDEYLKYAENNRKEWEMRGEQVVEELIEMVKGES